LQNFTGFKVFGELCSSVFLAHDLSFDTKRLVYQSVVLGVLLYGTEAFKTSIIHWMAPFQVPGVCVFITF